MLSIRNYLSIAAILVLSTFTVRADAEPEATSLETKRKQATTHLLNAYEQIRAANLHRETFEPKELFPEAFRPEKEGLPLEVTVQYYSPYAKNSVITVRGCALITENFVGIDSGPSDLGFEGPCALTAKDLGGPYSYTRWISKTTGDKETIRVLMQDRTSLVASLAEKKETLYRRERMSHLKNRGRSSRHRDDMRPFSIEDIILPTQLAEKGIVLDRPKDEIIARLSNELVNELIADAVNHIPENIIRETPQVMYKGRGLDGRSVAFIEQDFQPQTIMSPYVLVWSASTGEAKD